MPARVEAPIQPASPGIAGRFRPDIPLIAQLFATRDGLPQTRHRKRASPSEAGQAYAGVRASLARPNRPATDLEA